MNAKAAASQVIDEFGTNDIFKIAEKAGIKIIYESWFPISIGEFDLKTKRICVNLRAIRSDKDAAHLEKTIIAHELGHFFAKNLNLSKTEEEKFCDNFARSLLEN